MRLYDMPGLQTIDAQDPMMARVEAAIAAIGAYDEKNDAKLDIDAHAERYRDSAPGLAKIFTEDEAVRDAAQAYTKLNDRANRARRQFEAAISSLCLLALLCALVAVFMSVIPHELPPWLRAVLALAAGFFVSELAIILMRWRGWLDEAWRWPIRLVLAALSAAGLYMFIPANMEIYAHDIRNLSVVVLAVTLLFADTSAGGVLARIFNSARKLVWRLVQSRNGGGRPKIEDVDVSHLAVKQQWYELRGLAEDRRRSLFMHVVESKVADGEDLLSQKLEYVRRYHIEEQQGYFEYMRNRNRQEAALPSTLKSLAFAVSALSAIVLLLLLFALNAEQHGGEPWFADASGWLMNLTRAGLGDVAVLCALFFIGIYGYAMLTTALLQKAATHDRYSIAWAQLRRMTSPNPGVAEMSLQLPLTVARKAALAGNVEAVISLVREVNRLLAAEFGNWSPVSRYTIEQVKSGDGRTVPLLRSTARLTGEHFEWVSRDIKDYGVVRREARKVLPVRARRAETAEVIHAHGADGPQSSDTAEPGDWIVTKLDAAAVPVRNAQGHLDQWPIKSDRFPQLYDHTPTPDAPDLYRPKGAVEALRFEGGLEIVAASGQHQSIRSGYLVRNGHDVYGIDATTFHDTYAVVGEPAAASAT